MIFRMRYGLCKFITGDKKKIDIRNNKPKRYMSIPIGKEKPLNKHTKGLDKVGNIIKLPYDKKGMDVLVCRVDGDISEVISYNCLFDMPMHGSHEGFEGFLKSDLCKFLNTDIYNKFPNEIKNHIIAYQDEVFIRIPTEKQISGDNELGFKESDFVTQFEPMKLIRNKIAQDANASDKSSHYWLENGYKAAPDISIIYDGFNSYLYMITNPSGVRIRFLINNKL